MPEPTVTVRLTRNELQTIAWAVASLAVERRTRSGVSLTETSYPEPGETDLCCEHHKRQYEQNKLDHEVLSDQYQRTRTLAEKTAEFADHRPDDVSDSPVITALHGALLERDDTLGAQRLLEDEQGVWDTRIGPLLDELSS